MQLHPSEGRLRAYLDNELDGFNRARVNWHIQRCGRCAESFAELKGRSSETRVLLDSLEPAVNVEDSWERYQAQIGGIAKRSRHAAALTGILAASIAIGVFYYSRGATKAYGNVQESCCEDHNGDGVVQEGMVRVVHGAGRFDLVYEDVDGSGTLSAGDIVRVVDRRK